ncbi:MAG TPA: HlyD family efflux transporter periplasmic adaptor subunit, partial [Planctomycetota bacterium]|nr:HlyD family efflux transporter periplasmic adaptor subunit [Planctomycetota bacterium]
RETGRLAYLEQQKNEAIVTAPAPGVVQTLDLRPGDLVAAGAPVARMIQPQEQWVRGYVPEVDLGWVRVGQRATVKVDTWPKRTFGGTVTEIRTRAEYTPRNVQTLSQREEQVFGVKVVLDPAPELKPGMAAIVTVARAAAPKGARS